MASTFVVSALLSLSTRHCKVCCQSCVTHSPKVFLFDVWKRQQRLPSYSALPRSSSQSKNPEHKLFPFMANTKKPSELTEVAEDVEPPVVTLLDSKLNRSLSCYVEHEFDYEGTTFVVLSPYSQPVFFASYQRDQTGELELMPLEDEELVDRLFPAAFRTLAEQDIVLNRSAVTLTIDGDLENLEEDPEVEIEAEEDVRLVGTFMDGETEHEYYVFANMDPFLILGKKSGDSVILLGNGEFDRVAPIAEKKMEEVLERRGF